MGDVEIQTFKYLDAFICCIIRISRLKRTRLVIVVDWKKFLLLVIFSTIIFFGRILEAWVVTVRPLN